MGNSFQMTPAAAATTGVILGMNLSVARATLRINAVNAGDKAAYADADLDTAIKVIGDDLSRRTMVTMAVTVVTLAKGVTDLPAIDDDFLQERLRAAYLDGANVKVDAPGAPPWGGWQRAGVLVGGRESAWMAGASRRKPELDIWSYQQLQEYTLYNSGLAEQPVALAFETPRTAKVFPAPDDDYTLRVRWVRPFTEWYTGQALLTAAISGSGVGSVAVNSGGSIYLSAPAISFSGGGGTGATATANVAAGRMTSINVTAAGTGYTSAPTVLVNGQDATDRQLSVPDDYLRTALLHGGTAALQFADLKRRYAAPSWQRYEEFVAMIAGAAQAPTVGQLRRRY